MNLLYNKFYKYCLGVIMKRFVSFFLVITLLLSCINFFDISTYAEEKLTFMEYLVNSTKQFKKKVDVSSYIRNNDWDLDDIKLQLKYFYLSEPEMFYVDRTVAIQHSNDLSNVIICFDYVYSKSKAEKMNTKMKAAAMKAVERITDDMTSVEKALAVHDYIILNCSYDHEEKDYTAYDCLVKKSSVCQGYSLAFMYIMRDILGIDCTVVFTDTQNHAWNAIKIGKHWYHVDLTSDDPTFTTAEGKAYDGGGEVLHENFLLSDEGIYASSPLHRDWYALDTVKAKNTRYDNFFWRSSNSAMFKINGLWYYSVIDKSSPGITADGGSDDIYTKICTYNPETGKKRVIKRVNSVWKVYRNQKTGETLDGDYRYTRSYLKLVAMGDRIYYNTNNAVYRIDTKTGKVKKVHTLNKDGMQIFSLVPYTENKFRIIYKRDISYDNKYITLKIS